MGSRAYTKGQNHDFFLRKAKAINFLFFYYSRIRKILKFKTKLIYKK